MLLDLKSIIDKNYFVDKKKHFVNNKKIRQFVTLLCDICEIND